MTSKTLFNMNTKLKNAVIKKARKEGMTLSDVLNLSTRAYLEGKFRIMAVDRDTAEALDDIANGRIVSQEALFKKLGL